MRRSGLCARHANVCFPQSSFVPLLPWHNYQRAALRTRSLQVRFLPGVPIHGHVVKPEQRRVQTQNLAALGVQFPSCPPAFARSTARARLPRRSTQCARGLHRPSRRASARQAGVWFTGNSRPVRLKIEQPWECKSPHADQPPLYRASARRANLECQPDECAGPVC